MCFRSFSCYITQVCLPFRILGQIAEFMVLLIKSSSHPFAIMCCFFKTFRKVVNNIMRLIWQLTVTNIKKKICKSQYCHFNIVSCTLTFHHFDLVSQNTYFYYSFDIDLFDLSDYLLFSWRQTFIIFFICYLLVAETGCQHLEECKLRVKYLTYSIWTHWESLNRYFFVHTSSVLFPSTSSISTSLSSWPPLFPPVGNMARQLPLFDVTSASSLVKQDGGRRRKSWWMCRVLGLRRGVTQTVHPSAGPAAPE